MIDNYDSFTYNVVQAIRGLGAEVAVYRNDAITAKEARALDVSHVVISPGPGRPEDAGVSLDIIRAFAEDTPVMGVCLGHQAVVTAFGGKVIHASRIMHGKTSHIVHDGKGLFAGLPVPLEVGRYHSLAAERDTVPDELEVTAHTDNGEVMAVRHTSLPVESVQFHPESVLTPDGDRLLGNFLSKSA
ncbi:MAG: aminodeoxychorismate/anthranilate synthase component II [Pseudomonadota bacterium]